MTWSIVQVLCLWENHPGKLPAGKFILTDGHTNKHANGWLPCHHRNISYHIVFKPNGDILNINNITMLKGKKKPKVVAKAFKYSITREEYNIKADIAYRDQATWTIAVLYRQWRIMPMDVQQTFQIVTNDPEQLYNRYSEVSIVELHYNKEKALEAVNRALSSWGDAPLKDLSGFNARMDWQIATKYNTASFKSPGKHIRNIQKYQELWTTQEEIEMAKTIRNAIRTDNCDVHLGSPTNNTDGIVVVKTEEDYYRIQCYVETDNIVIMNNRTIKTRNQDSELEETSINNQRVCIPWAHTWGINDWLKLIEHQPKHYTCIGRLDQYARDRGQIFQNMIDAKWNVTKNIHIKVPRVEMVQVDDVPTFLQNIQAKVIQCFSDEKWPNADTGRRWLTNPRRIRTLTTREDVSTPRIPLVEEEFTLHVGNNASVVPVWSYRGLPVEVGVYLCGPKTKAFDVHVARTHCRYKMYVVNCTTSLFSWENKVPKRITINPFI